MIHYSMNCAEKFPQTPLIGYRWTRNLRDILVKAQIEYPPPPPKPRWQEIRPNICQRLGQCTYCHRIKKLNTIKSHSIGTSHQIVNLPNHRLITCEISNIIYCINCTTCGTQYVGETGTKARNRLYEYIYSIKNANKISTLVSEHMHSHIQTQTRVILDVDTKTNHSLGNQSYGITYTIYLYSLNIYVCMYIYFFIGVAFYSFVLFYFSIVII
jgi:hypothetical protein